MVLRMTSSGYEDALVHYQAGSHEKRKKYSFYICIKYLICKIYCIYLICILYILYITYIYRVKSEWYINRTSFKHILGDPRDR